MKVRLANKARKRDASESCNHLGRLGYSPSTLKAEVICFLAYETLGDERVADKSGHCTKIKYRGEQAALSLMPSPIFLEVKKITQRGCKAD